jgi:hypothetical protein
MNVNNEFEALQVSRARIEAAERRRPWLLAEAGIKQERGRTKADLFFDGLARYMELHRTEPADFA